MPDTDPVASALDGRLDVIRAHSDLDGPRFNPNFTCDVHVPRLLAAVEAALKLADDLDAEAARLLATAARLRTGAATGTQNRAWAHRDCAEAIREAIGAALAGKETGDGG